MKFIKSKDGKEGICDLAFKISSTLNEGKKVLWLICGGSNVPLAVDVMNQIRAQVAPEKISNLIVGQTDERYGPIGHKDSNWQQLLDQGLSTSYVTTLPILVGKSLASTVSDYTDRLKPHIDEIISTDGMIVGQFGIGSDGHVAGIIPGSIATEDKKLVSGYEAGTFIRVTVNPPGLKMINLSYCFAFGASKKDAVISLRDKDLTIKEQPAQILKLIPESYLYSDQL